MWVFCICAKQTDIFVIEVPEKKVLNLLMGRRPEFYASSNTFQKYCFLFVFSANKAKVFFGLLREPDINIPLDDDDDTGDGEDKPKVCLQT